MKILFISQVFPYPPFRDGARLIAYNLLKYLSKQNEIFLISFIESEDEKQSLPMITPYCDIIEIVPYFLPKSVVAKVKDVALKILEPRRYLSSIMASKIKDAIFNWKPDLVHAELPMMSHYAETIGSIPKIIASIDAISLPAFKNINASLNPVRKIKWYLLYKQRRGIESDYFPLFDACTVVSDEDKIFLEGHCHNLRIEVIPSGVDVDFFNPNTYHDTECSQPIIGLFGIMNYSPNVDAALFFYSEIFPLIKKSIPNSRLYIVGRNPTHAIRRLSKNGEVIVTGEVSDIRPYIAKSTVVVSPIRLGSGIKTTVLHAMAMAKPVVATAQAVKAIRVIDGLNVLIADKPADFAKRVIEVLNNTTLREKISENARNLIVERYTWESHALKFQSLYEEVVNN